MKSLVLSVLLVCALVGLGDSVYLAREHYSNIIPPCTVGAFADCGKVLQSPYAVMFGIPLAVIGIVQYGLLTLFLISIIFLNKKTPQYLVVVQSVIGFLGSMYFVYLQLFIIRAI